MNKRIKKKWLKALRGGKYEQATGSLRNGDKFCCLGVLCDIHRIGGGGRWSIGAYVLKNGHEDYAGLPDEVAEWAGLVGAFAQLPTECTSKKDLAAANDQGGRSFKQIANLIERWL